MANYRTHFAPEMKDLLWHSSIDQPRPSSPCANLHQAHAVYIGPKYGGRKAQDKS